MTTRQSRHNTKTRKARRDSGLCAFCGRPSETYRCRECQDAENERQNQRRAVAA